MCDGWTLLACVRGCWTVGFPDSVARDVDHQAAGVRTSAWETKHTQTLARTGTSQPGCRWRSRASRRAVLTLVNSTDVDGLEAFDPPMFTFVESEGLDVVISGGCRFSEFR